MWIALQDPSVSNFYINGYNRFGPAARNFAVCASVSAWVAESLQVELMSDNRMCNLHSDLWQIAASEVRWIVDFKEGLWELLAQAAGVDMWGLRHNAIHASHVSFHFIWRRILEPSGDLPWSLTRGMCARIWMCSVQGMSQMTPSAPACGSCTTHPIFPRVSCTRPYCC